MKESDKAVDLEGAAYQNCHVAALNVGPDSLLLVWGAIVSIVVALLAWRRVGVVAASTVTLVVALALVGWLLGLESTSPAHRLVATSFILAPSALLLGASRLNWLARRPWLLVLLGPVLFVVCFGGICTFAFRVLGA